MSNIALNAQMTIFLNPSCQFLVVFVDPILHLMWNFVDMILMLDMMHWYGQIYPLCRGVRNCNFLHLNITYVFECIILLSPMSTIFPWSFVTFGLVFPCVRPIFVFFYWIFKFPLFPMNPTSIWSQNSPIVFL